MILGHGIDVVSIERMKNVIARQGSHFMERVFSEAERSYSEKKSEPHIHFAARFAAKEAFAKAMKLGLGASGDLTEIEVGHDAAGAPVLHLKGRAKELFLQSGYKNVVLSLAHDGDTAMASVILTA